jgi:hypothetical protein
MKVDINTSIDISRQEEDYLRTFFPKESFEIQKTVFTPGIDTTYLILNFIISSVAGGVLYDLMKAGIKKLFKKKARETRRPFAITLKYKDKFYKIKGEEVSRLGENGTYVFLDSIDEMFKEIESVSEENDNS